MKILNKNIHKIPKDAVYVGRGSMYGNPFEIGKDGNRGTVIAKFEEMLKKDESLMALVRRNLKGKDLVCFCAPSYCHAEILYEVANGSHYLG